MTCPRIRVMLTHDKLLITLVRGFLFSEAPIKDDGRVIAHLVKHDTRGYAVYRDPRFAWDDVIPIAFDMLLGNFKTLDVTYVGLHTPNFETLRYALNIQAS